jgi:uncharacterized SAM-binding protein YcdF (DUF218 family)
MKIKFRSARRGKERLIMRSLLILMAFWLTLLGFHLAFNLVVKLPRNAKSPVDGVFVLGGSISREIYAAKLAQKNAQIPILIARGSPDPCLVWLFQKTKSPTSNIWLEICSRSTFTNFMFGLPILENWQVHKVQLITSGTHITRAKWLAKILLGSHGIWVDLVIAPERGVPGNRESWAKTGIDLTRATIWAFLSQMIKPSCSNVYLLNSVDLKVWQDRNFACEQQGGIGKVKSYE